VRENRIHARLSHPHLRRPSRADVGSTVRLSGWIHRKRDHGGVLFVDLRDHYGLTQLVCRAGSEALTILDSLRVESVVTMTGEVVGREGGAVNAKLATGDIEVVVERSRCSRRPPKLPMPVAGEQEYPEDIRLATATSTCAASGSTPTSCCARRSSPSIRNRMIGQGFTEFQTPILTASSPEGARDYLVPSRVHPGKFYALPQAPQMFKQLLMVAGFDRYFQIAPCFRDEDARADRSPGEFYQLDFEMSFVTQDDVFARSSRCCRAVRGIRRRQVVTAAGDFPRIPYRKRCSNMAATSPICATR
jgi:aspartyl-tRNA synthetase